MKESLTVTVAPVGGHTEEERRDGASFLLEVEHDGSRGLLPTGELTIITWNGQRIRLRVDQYEASELKHAFAGFAERIRTCREEPTWTRE